MGELQNRSPRLAAPLVLLIVALFVVAVAALCGSTLIVSLGTWAALFSGVWAFVAGAAR